MSSTIRSAGRAAMLCLSALALSSCMYDAGPWPPPAPNIRLIQANPDLYAGQNVTIAGNVHRVLRPGVFTIDDTIGGRLLVIADAAPSPLPQVKSGQAVVISGLATRYKPGLEAKAGAGLAGPTVTPVAATRAATGPAPATAEKPTPGTPAPAQAPGNWLDRAIADHEWKELPKRWQGRMAIVAVRVTGPIPNPLP